MSKEEKIAILLTQLDDDTQLIKLLRHIIKDSINTVPEENINTIYNILNPE